VDRGVRGLIMDKGISIKAKKKKLVSSF